MFVCLFVCLFVIFVFTFTLFYPLDFFSTVVVVVQYRRSLKFILIKFNFLTGRKPVANL